MVASVSRVYATGVSLYSKIGFSRLMVFLIVSSLQPVTVPSRVIPLLVSCDALVHWCTRRLSTGGLGVALCERWSVQRFLGVRSPISQMFFPLCTISTNTLPPLLEDRMDVRAFLRLYFREAGHVIRGF
jgi:hypothetical protein